ncbi:MAG: BlaI/MecI/CopY family transcriptional regulator [Lacrimispora sp.]|uniref:BlaI/MecI/CopY family transcriptional regulator n=1 Tax=Lacrimispora sp. TaxID=2719234 RepID=UPI0039E2C0DB
MQYNISSSEWYIMQVLWASDEPMTSAEIVTKVKDGRDRSPTTIKTLLQRLVSKGFVDFTVDAADSRIYHYRPRVTEDECVEKENRDFVSLYYRGDVGGMLARFIGDSDLSPEQIKELTALLEAKKEDGV